MYGSVQDQYDLSTKLHEGIMHLFVYTTVNVHDDKKKKNSKELNECLKGVSGRNEINSDVECQYIKRR